MTNVFFYHLPNSMGSLFPVLVDLLDMSLRQELDTLILVADEKQAIPLHRHLQQRFNLGPDLAVAERPTARHSLCWSDDPGHHHGILINLTDTLPPWFSRFDYLAELICGDEPLVERKRQHYKLCRHRGYPLTYHDWTRNNREGLTSDA